MAFGGKISHILFKTKINGFDCKVKSELDALTVFWKFMQSLGSIHGQKPDAPLISKNISTQSLKEIRIFQTLYEYFECQ